jgi:hypothetical protein
MPRILAFLFLVFIATACNTNENKKETKTDSPDTSQNQIYLPSISMEELKILWDNCNQVDYIYYDLPISTSLDDQYSIQQGLRHISETPVPLNVKNNCKPLGRIFYKDEGEDLIEAEIYFATGCTFFVFFKEGKPAYSNLMTGDGIKHFTDIMQKALSLQPKR